MKRRGNDFLLGLATILFVALFLGTFFFLAARPRGESRPVTVQFIHSAGVAPLKAGSPILLSGAIDVGRVTGLELQEIEVDTPRGKQPELVVVVRCEINRNLKLYEGVQFTTDQPAVGGGASLVILDVGEVGRELDESRPIWGAAPQSLASAISTLSRRLLAPGGLVDQIEYLLSDAKEGSPVFKISQSLGDLNAITDSLRTQLTTREHQTLIAKIHGMLDDLSSVTTALRTQTLRDDGTMLSKVHALLDRLDTSLVQLNEMLAENRPLVKSTITNLDAVTSSLAQQLTPAFVRELDRGDDSTLIAKLHKSMDRLNDSLANVVEMSDQGRRLVLLNRPAVDRTIENLKEASEQLRIGVQELLLSPWKLFQPPAPGERERVDAFTAARRFAEAAAYLNDAATRLEAVVAAMPAGGGAAADEDLVQIRGALRAAFDRFNQAEDFLWQQMRK